MTKHLLLLVGGALLFAIGIADLVANAKMSPYILLVAGLGLGALAVHRIQKQKPQ